MLTAAVQGEHGHTEQAETHAKRWVPSGEACAMNRRLGQRGGCAALPRLALVAACVVAVVCATPQAGGEGPLEQTGGKALREALDSLW